MAAPSPGDITRDLDKWSDAVLDCRSLQHAWQGRTAAYSSRYHYYRVSLHCGRCGTVKTQELDKRGFIISSWYTYPEGYLSTNGRMTAEKLATIRLAGVQRGSIGKMSGKDAGPRRGGQR